MIAGVMVMVQDGGLRGLSDGRGCEERSFRRGRMPRTPPTRAIVGLRPSFSAHGPGFPARGTTNRCVCGFHQGKPHGVRQRQETQQEIRVYAGANMGHPSDVLRVCFDADSWGLRLRLSKQVLDAHRKLAHSNTGGVVDGRSDGCRDPGKAYLPYSACP
jgi:hypothetical protein